MNQNVDIESDADGCVFPTGPDGEVCSRPVAKNGKPVGGRRPLYCDDPDHTRGKAFAVRRRYELAAARGQSNGQRVVQVELAVSERPVTDGRVSLGALVARFEESSAQLATILERAVEVVRTVSDPDAAGYEVEQTQREAAIQVAQAQGSQAAAEQEARAARQQGAREAELRAQAEKAAEHALRDVEQMTGELAEARSARTRAEAEKESVQRAADHDRATVQALRGQLEQQRHDHRRELETVRHEAHEERAALARQYADQMAAVLATLQQVGGHTQSTPATPKTKTTTQATRKNSRTKQA
jgi:colicin import membrane protein